MDNEVYEDFSHEMIVRAIVERAKTAGDSVTTELRLPNRKIADIAILTSMQRVIIIEVKAHLTPSLISAAWSKYFRWCNELYIAAPTFRLLECPPSDTRVRWGTRYDRAGLLRVSWAGIVSIRDPQPTYALQSRVVQTRELILARSSGGEAGRE